MSFGMCVCMCVSEQANDPSYYRPHLCVVFHFRDSHSHIGVIPKVIPQVI